MVAMVTRETVISSNRLGTLLSQTFIPTAHLVLHTILTNRCLMQSMGGFISVDKSMYLIYICVRVFRIGKLKG